MRPGHWLFTIPLRLRSLFRRTHADQELGDELRDHLERKTEEYVAQGMTQREAHRRARLDLGGIEQTKEKCRDARRVNWIQDFVQDLRYGLRMLRKSPGFSAVAVLTLALGIGANTAVFSVVNALLLRPLPVKRPNELAFVENARYGPGQSFPNYKDLRDRNHTFAGLVGYRIAPMEMETDTGMQRIWGYLATGNYFDVFGVQPVLGRFFTQGDDLHPGASPYAVLSYSAWRSRFAANPAIVGSTIRLNRLPYTVLGVAPPDFHGTELFYWPEVWVPMMMEPRIESIAWLDQLFLSQALSRWRAPMDFPVQFNVNPDWRVFLFALSGAIIASALFGSAPAWRASRTDPNAVLRGASGARRGGRLAFRDLLVVVQVALCFVLVSASFLSLRGLQQALQMNLGFQPQHVATAAFELNLAGYSPERGRAFQQQALEAVQQLPGVQSAAYSNSVPLSIDQSHTSVFPVDKTDSRPSDRIGVVFYQVSPGFFATIGTKLLAGREFTWHDDVKSPQVAIVNLAFAKRVLHTDNAVGKRFRGGVLGPFLEVIGVAEDGKYESLTESQQPVVFWSILQSYNSTTTVEVKSALPATQMVTEIRQAIARLDPELPLYGVGSLEQMLGFAFFPTRAAAIALSAFGLLVIVLAATGIHGLVAYAVSRRTHEIGIRMAIGARPAEVLRLVLGKTAALLVFGSLVGLSLALAVGQVISSIVYETQPRDPLVMVSTWVSIALLGLFASWAPARRAMKVDPMVALRYE